MAFKFGAHRVMVASLAAKNKSQVNKLVYVCMTNGTILMVIRFSKACKLLEGILLPLFKFFLF